jgi:hypothetical protein
MPNYFRKRDRRFLGAGIVGADQIEDGAIGLTSSKLAEGLLRYAELAISAAQIIAVGAGNLGHANGMELVAAPAAGKSLELVSAILIYQFGVTGYTAGGNLTVNWGGGGAAITGLVSAANSLGAGANKQAQFVPLAAAAGIMPVTPTGLNLVSSAAFTNPGTATGIVRVKVLYRVHLTGL